MLGRQVQITLDSAYLCAVKPCPTQTEYSPIFADSRKLMVALLEGILFFIPDHRTAVDRRLPMISQGLQGGQKTVRCYDIEALQALHAPWSFQAL